MDVARVLNEFNQSVAASEPQHFAYYQLELGPPATAAQVAELEARLGRTIPASLKAFYLQYGGIKPVHGQSETYLIVRSVPAILKALTSTDNDMASRMPDLGLVSQLEFSWGNDRWELEPDEVFSSEEIASLNAHYLCFGLYRPNLERAFYLYVDSNDNYGVVHYDQDQFDDLEVCLRDMMEASPADMTFDEVMADAFEALPDFRD